MFFLRVPSCPRWFTLGQNNPTTHRCHCRRIYNLADAESYSRFGIGRNAIAQCRTISPQAHRAQNLPVFAPSPAVQNEGAVHVSVGSDNETDPHPQIVILSFEQWVGRKQRFRRTHVPTFRQCQRFRHGRELRDMRRKPAQVSLELCERSLARNVVRRGGHGAPAQNSAEDSQRHDRRDRPRSFPARPDTPHRLSVGN